MATETVGKMIGRLNGGGILKVRASVDEQIVLPIPHTTMLSAKDIRIWTEPVPLNEFGYFYVALYILGNYARYYPDKWVRDIEQASPLALAVEQLLLTAKNRMALLTLSELTSSYHVPETEH